MNKADNAKELHKLEQAEDLIIESREIFGSQLPKGHWRIYTAQGIHGEILAKRGEYQKAESLLLEAFDKLSKSTLSDYVSH